MTITAQLGLAAHETISGQLEFSAGSRAKARATASATARRTAALHARMDELRDSRGRWVTSADPAHNGKLANAATGRAARAVRVHDVVLYGKTEPAPYGFGLQQRTVPMEVTKVTHHFEGSGKTRSGISRRHRFTDMELLDPTTGDTINESVKDGVSVKLFPREDMKALDKGKIPAAPVSPPSAFPNFKWPSPAPAPREVQGPAAQPPAVVPGETLYHGTSQVYKPGDIIDAGHADPKLRSLQGADYAYASTTPGDASFFGESKAGRGGVSHTYAVEPVGGYEVDPHMGGAATSRRSKQGFRVVQEVENYTGKPLAPQVAGTGMASPGDYAGAPDVTQRSLDEARTVVGTAGLSAAEHEVMSRELARNLDKVPAMQGVLKRIDLNEHLGATAITGPDRITFNPKYIHDPGLLTRGEQKWQATGFTVPDPGAAGPYAGLRAVMTHEFGHAITWKAAHDKTPAGNAVTQRALAGAIAGRTFPTSAAGLKQAQAVLSDHNVTGTTVSAYGSSSWPELSAESYSAWSLGGHGKAADAGAALVATLGHATPTHCKGLPKPDDDVTGPQPGAVAPGIPSAAPVKAAAKPGVPDPSDESGQRLIRLWSNTTIGFRYLGNEHLGLGTRANDFSNELHRMLTSTSPPASNSPGTKDAHKFMQMIDAYAEPQAAPVYRGMRLNAGQAGQLFPPGGTVDLPVASFTTDTELAERYTRNTQASDVKSPVVLTVEQGAMGFDLGKTSGEHQVLSGGRFKVSSSSTSGGTTYITLTQQDFSAH